MTPRHGRGHDVYFLSWSCIFISSQYEVRYLASLLLVAVLVLTVAAAALVEEVVEDVHGHGEDDSRVVLRRDAIQRLQVAQLRKERVKVSQNGTRAHLQGGRTLCNDSGCLPQGLAGFLLADGRNHLESVDEREREDMMDG